MKIKAIITGSTGMVGKGVLFECLANNNVEKVLVINRSSVNIDHPKLTEIIHKDLSNLEPIKNQLSDYNACFFCLGISSFRMSEEDYSKITFDLTAKFADTIFENTQEMVFCFVSGAGTNPEGSSMWSRIKGKAENYILEKGFKDAYAFRPAYIQPAKGIQSKTPLYNFMLPVVKLLYPILKRVVPSYVTSTNEIGNAMINAVLKGDEVKRLESNDINRLAKK